MVKQLIGAVVLSVSSVSAFANVGQILFGLADGATAEISDGGISLTPASPGENIRASTATGIFSEVQGTNGSFNDFSETVMPTGNILWTIGAFKLEITSLEVYSLEPSPPAQPLDLFASGDGILYENDEVLPYVGEWSLSLDRPQVGALFSFSSNVVATPEPASMALIGIGLVGLGLSRRRQAADA